MTTPWGMALDPVPEPSEVVPGVTFVLLCLLLLAATLLLWFSMRKQLKKIRFPDDPAPGDEGVEHPPAPGRPESR